MKQDYNNLSLFDVTTVFMIVLGIGLIVAQFYIAMPQPTQQKVISTMDIFDMGQPAQDVLAIQATVVSFITDSMTEFYDQVYVAIGEIALPVADDITQQIASVQRVAQSVFQYSDSLASNYQGNYASSGVETGMGGKVMGAYINNLPQ